MKTDAQALFDACRNNDINTLVDLIEHQKTDPNLSFDHGATALMVATQEGHKDIVLYLLQHKANPNQLAEGKVSALMIAAAKGNTEIGKILVEYGANTAYTPKK